MLPARIALLLALAVAPATVVAGPPAPVMINCTDAVGIPGGIASVEVTMFREGEALVVATQNDLTYDVDRFSIDAGDCVINPEIGPGTAFNKQLQQSILPDDRGLRSILVALDNTLPIPPGLLYTCPFRVAEDTPLGGYEIGNVNLVASNQEGMQIPVSGAGCSIEVAEPTVTPTPTPRCRTNEDCPEGQVCVDGECQTPTVTATPSARVNTPTSTASATPIGFCEDNDDCPPGQVCIDNMCVTVTPTPRCRQDMDCPSGEVCVDGECVTATPTATPTTRRSGGGGGCNCEIDPAAPTSGASNTMAILVPALLLVLRWRTRRTIR